jgi:hypothetical protein
MAKDNTGRNIMLIALGLFLLMPKKSKGGTGSTYAGGGNGYAPSSGSEGDIGESYLGIIPTSLNRGIRNNNPGNVKFYNSNAWQGKVSLSQNTDSLDTDGEPKFEQFTSYPYGVRVMIYLLKNRYIPNGHNTLTKILDRYDPGFNPGYLQHLVDRVGISANQTIGANDETIIKKIVQALTRWENGQTNLSSPEVVTDIQYQTARNIL